HTRSKRDWSSDVCSSDLIRVAYNNISSSVQITPSGLETMFNGQLSSRLNSFGHNFYFDGKYVGRIGTDYIKKYPTVRGLNMNLEDYGEYMAFTYRTGALDPDDPNEVAMIWSKGNSAWERGFHFNEDIKIKHNKVIETLWLRPSNFNSVSERISF